MIDEKKLKEIRHLAARMRRDIILMVGVGQPGHIGGSCSLAGIVGARFRSEKKKLKEIRHLAARMRRDIILMVGVGQPGHIGGSCSSADIVAALYGCKMKHDPKNPKWEGRDRFLMSKGHAAIIQYAAIDRKS